MQTVPTKPQRMLPLLLMIALCGAALPAQAQTFTSGSTGADGPFAPTRSQSVQIPASGVFNYTTVNIPSNVTITYLKNAKNSPVTMLATGDVTVAGTINISGGSGSTTPSGVGTGVTAFRGMPGAGGPGGYNGGGGGAPGYVPPVYNGQAGDGPGGGGGGLGSANASVVGDGGGGSFATAGVDGVYNSTSGASDGKAGPVYGSTSLLQLVGGSGGGGGGGIAGAPGSGGGGGGGAIVIASSGTLTLSGDIYAFGGEGSSGGYVYTGTSYIYSGAGGAGAGGAVRLVATTLAGGGGQIDVNGGYNSFNNNGYGNGYARIEAYNFNSLPSVYGTTVIAGAPNSVVLPNPPQLTIASVGGVAAPSTPKGSFSAPPDVTLPSSITGPVTVGLLGANIPVGTVVSVMVSPEVGVKTAAQSSPLMGTQTASSATASVTLPASMLSLLYAAATISLTSAQTSSLPPLIINGERVTRIQVAAAFGGQSQATYITEAGHHYTREEILGLVTGKAAKGDNQPERKVGETRPRRAAGHPAEVAGFIAPWEAH